MTMTMTTNQQVQFYLTYSDKRASKHRKIQRIQQLEKELEQRHIFLDELFQRKTIRVLDEIAYMTTICGVIKVGADKLSQLSGTSVRTVYNAIRTIKQNPMGFYVGYLKGSHKYVFVDLKHTDAREMLVKLFNLSKSEIESIFAVHFAVHLSSENSSIPMNKVDISPLNSITNNKTLINKKTSTKDSKPSALNNNLYAKLKALYEARKGSLSNFRVIVGKIYSTMKKLKADVTVKLSHVEIESIMYRSLDALLNMSNVKNEMAMLTGIIKNKIQDLIQSVSAPAHTNTANKRVELIPEWFDGRNTSNNSNNTVVEPSLAPTVDFELEKARVLAKIEALKHTDQH